MTKNLWVLGGVLALPALLTACGQGSQAGENGEKVDWIEFNPNLVYGNDDRLDTYQVQNTVIRENIKSTVALMEASNLSSTARGYQIHGGRFADEYNLCAEEPFREQTTAAFCSGSLVGADLVMTAGHCVRSAINCANTKLVFSFELSAAGHETLEVGVDDVYSCKEIIKREEVGTGRDYAIIRLDRPVVGRIPLALRREGRPAVGDEIYVIGHPAGLPTKVAAGAQIRRVSSEHFVANLDTYGGNSGSAVFSSRTGLIEGILVRGDTDFVSRGGCTVSNRCSDTGCRGEDVTLASWALPHVPDSEEESSPPPVQTEIYASTTSVAIPDYPGTAVTSSVSAATSPGARKIQVKVDVSHAWIGDLELRLVAPDGSERLLHSRTGREKDDIRGTYGIDLTAAQSLDVLSSVRTGGVWKLKVQDKARADVGKINSWSLIFKVQ